MATSLRDLKAIFDFDDSDLRANRQGKLSKRQVLDLKIQAEQQLKSMLIVPTLVVMWIMISLQFWVALPGTLLILLLCLGVIALHREQRKTLHHASIIMLSGKLQKHVANHRYGAAQCVISVGGTQLPVERQLYDQLTEGKFTIYMLNDQIMSMEPYRTKKTSKTPAKTSPTKRTTTSRKATTTASTSKRSSHSRTSAQKTTASSGKMATPTGKVSPKPMVRSRKAR